MICDLQKAQIKMKHGHGDFSDDRFLGHLKCTAIILFLTKGRKILSSIFLLILADIFSAKMKQVKVLHLFSCSCLINQVDKEKEEALL